MRHDEIIDALSYLDEDIIEETNEVRQNPKGRKILTFPIILRRVSLAACLAIICIVSVSLGITRLGAKNEVQDEHSVKTEDIMEEANESAPNVESKENSSSSELQSADREDAAVTGEQETSQFLKDNTVIFKGTVTAIEFSEIELEDGIKQVCIAHIQVDEIYRLDLPANEEDTDVLTVLLPRNITDNAEYTDFLSHIQVGTTGIFMPIQYHQNDVNSYIVKNNEKIYLKEIADFGFLDGQQYAFLETEAGLVFDQETHTNIAVTSTLDEVEDYVLELLEITY